MTEYQDYIPVEENPVEETTSKESFYNTHYIQVDEKGRIVYGFSDAFRQPLATDICINEQGGYQFRLFQDGEENPPLIDLYGIPLYKYEGGAVVARSTDEIDADRAVIPAVEQPTPIDQRVVAIEDAITVLMFGGDGI